LYTRSRYGWVGSVTACKAEGQRFDSQCQRVLFKNKNGLNMSYSKFWVLIGQSFDKTYVSLEIRLE
jgi:hypothetical protein